MTMKCPQCGSEKIADILYGYPGFSPELDKLLDKGKVVLGGCCITDNDPLWRCTECGNDINEETKKRSEL